MNKIPLLFLVLLFFGCSSEITLQEYFVSKAEDGNFLVVNIPTSALGVVQENLTESDQEVLSSFHKLNVLAYKVDSENPEFMKNELATIRSIVSAVPYEELMTVNDSRFSGKVIVVGEDVHLEEVVFLGQSPKFGFVLARVLGSQMTTEKVAKLTKLIQEENIDAEAFTGLRSFF
jgi:hypothetical protein